MDKSELDRRVEEEAGKAFERWDHFDGDSRESMPEAVRPLVERIVELEQAPANVDAPQGETLIKRVGREVGPALDRWQACNDGNHSSMRAAIGPLVATIMGLESDLKTARDSGQVYADEASSNRKLIAEQRAEIGNLRAHLTAAQTAGRDQAAEIERMRAKVAELLASQDTCRRVAWHCADETKEVIADATRMAKESLSDLTRERETVRKLLSDNAALETTVDVLAGRLAARGQS